MLPKTWPEAFAILAAGLGVAAILAGGGLLVTGIGLGIRIATEGGVGVAAGIAAWAVPAASIGTATLGLAASGLTVVYVVREVEKRPILLSPVFGLLGGLATDLALESLPESSVSPAIFGAVSTALLTGGGAAIVRPSRTFKAAGAVLIAATPALLVVNVARSIDFEDPASFITGLDPLFVAAFGLLALAILGLALLLIAIERTKTHSFVDRR